MHRSGRKEVSLRGNSSREVSRDALLSKIAEERAARSKARKTAVAALLIQRVWRGRTAAVKARQEILQSWDATWHARASPGQPLPSAEELSTHMLRPLCICLRRERRREGGKGSGAPPGSQGSSKVWFLQRQREAQDIKRMQTALVLLVRSLDSADSHVHFCSLAIQEAARAEEAPEVSPGLVSSRQSRWQQQSRCLLQLASALVSQHMAGIHETGLPAQQLTQLGTLSVRVGMSLTDPSSWKFLLAASPLLREQATSQVLKVLPALLQTLPFCFSEALAAFIVKQCPAKRDETAEAGVGIGRETLMLLVAGLTLTLRPLLLQAPSALQADPSLAKTWKQAAQQLATHLYSVPLLPLRIPSALLKPLTHPSALLPVLHSFLDADTSVALQGRESSGGPGEVSLPCSLWALGNVSSLLCTPQQTTAGSPKKGAEAPRVLGGVPLPLFVDSIRMLAQKTALDLEEKRRTAEEAWKRGRGRGKAHREEDVEEEGDSESDEEGLKWSVPVDPRLLQSLAPLCEQWLVSRLLTSNSGTPSTASISLIQFGQLYSALLGLLLVLRVSSSASAKRSATALTALSLLNALSFTAGVLPALWAWLAICFGSLGHAPLKGEGSGSRAAQFQALPASPSTVPGSKSQQVIGPSAVRPRSSSNQPQPVPNHRAAQSPVPRVPSGGEGSGTSTAGTFWERARQGIFSSAQAPSGRGRSRGRQRGQRHRQGADGGPGDVGPSPLPPDWMDLDGTHMEGVRSGGGAAASPDGVWDPADEGAPLDWGSEGVLGSTWLSSVFSSQQSREDARHATALRERAAQEEAQTAADESEAVCLWDVRAASDLSLAAANRGSALKGSSVPTAESVGSLLELFCRAYSHLLLVLDDEEFYNLQSPFSLQDQRAIASTLNSFVYSSILSRHSSTSQSPGVSPALLEASVRCLRSLYDRDSRRRFCPALLWRAPALAHPLSATAAARAVRRRQQQPDLEEGEVPADLAERQLREQLDTPMLKEILKTVPHVLSFEDRVVIFRELIRKDRMEYGVVPLPGMPLVPVVDIRVRRDRLVEDGFALLGSLGSQLKGRVRVTFVDAFGVEEMGIDQGGLFKEFLTDLAKAAFNPNYGLFIQTATEEGLLYPSVAAAYLEDGLPMEEFLGRIVGKALYEGILLEYPFAPLFVCKLMGRYAFLDELSSLDAELYRNLMYLKHYDGDAQDLSLDFTVTEEVLGEHKTMELIRNGSNIPVTSENKRHYIHAVADYKLNKQMRRVVAAFIAGMSDIIPPSWLTMFNPQEFNQLLSGGDDDVDVADLRAHTGYSGGYSEADRTVRLFWEAVSGFSREEKRELLKFVTSCSRPPLLGFKYLHPPFTLHKGVSDEEFLPSAATCANTLKLPQYRKLSTLSEKLKYAIKAKAGFDFS